MSASDPAWPALDVAAQATDIAMYHAVEYAAVDGYRPLQLDLYLPAPRAEAAPAIVYLHGGGWSVGTRRRFGRAFRSWSPTPLERLARAGFTVATVDYRLSGEAAFPAPLHDAKAAVRWLRARADVLNIDPTRIMVWGESAGGHLAALVGLTAGDDDGFVGGDVAMSSEVCGVVEWYAPTDLTQLADAPGVAHHALLGGSASSLQPELARAASPALRAHAGAPPFQIHHGTVDDLVPFEQSELLVAALRSHGVPVDFVAVDGANHFWHGVADLATVFDASLAFACRICRHSPPDE